ncbi:hypothetical protein K440DRAFT_288492 [Wilcoxina mikolae CBS 423.85]|nr:hypothetical protein K440DRAFT_288492 [Wilcoxina mikolae CBS 423.85]
MDSEHYGNGSTSVNNVTTDLHGLGLGGVSNTVAMGVGSKDAPLVGIIGAGVAGLRAAQVLLEKGYNVAIFEARDRIGGRWAKLDPWNFWQSHSAIVGTCTLESA